MKQKNISDNLSHFNLEHNPTKSSLARITIVIPKDRINLLFDETVHTLKGSIKAYGFLNGEVPTEYISKQYKPNIIDHLKEFIFKYGIINELFQEIQARKLLVAGEPRLVDIALEYDQEAQFTFELNLFPKINLFEWKYFPFKSPNRKNYKDLDRQVEHFIQEEKEKLDLYTHEHKSTIGDWINFDIALTNSEKNIFDPHLLQNFWLKLGDEEVESNLRSLFLERNKGEEFFSNSKGIQDYFSDQLRTNYTFKISIVDIVPFQYFCFDQFKEHFKIKTNKDMHKKLIEVFSYRNDVSQRCAMVEEAFKLLLSKHRFFAPTQLVLRQQKIILSAIQKNPDYNVYRKQKDFYSWIQQLAEKQVKETLLIDQLIHDENITVKHEDIINYLNLNKRPRMREFIYFNMPDSKRDGQEVPWPKNELSRICAREKALNHVIYHLNKK